MIVVFVYASYRTHKKHYVTRIYWNSAECVTLKSILVLADKRILGVFWYKQVQVIAMLIGYKQSIQILYKPSIFQILNDTDDHWGTGKY